MKFTKETSSHSTLEFEKIFKMNFFKKNKLKKLKDRENKLLEKMKGYKLSKEELLGSYQLPPTFLKIQDLQNKELISTYSIGFELWLDRPITPAPKDLIPFAITGGDGCYFAFITDFGNQQALEDCPIAFVSPTDFNDRKPKQSRFLIAENIKGFLEFMISITLSNHCNALEILISITLTIFVINWKS